MSDLVLLLGPVTFQDFELPASINFGGKQRLALHRLPGGGRVIDALGRDDAQIHFSGIFSGSDATLRARSLDELRAAGTPLPLTWDVFFYTILISDFRADYRNGWWIPYQITCTVIRDEAADLAQPIGSLVTATLADVGAAVIYATDAGLDLAPVQTALTTPDATVRGTVAYTVALANLRSAQSSITTLVSAANAALSVIDFGNMVSSDDGVTGLLDAASASGQLGSLTSSGSYIGRALINLANAST